jgi:hypothetical protein
MMMCNVWDKLGFPLLLLLIAKCVEFVDEFCVVFKILELRCIICH